MSKEVEKVMYKKAYKSAIVSELLFPVVSVVGLVIIT